MNAWVLDLIQAFGYAGLALAMAAENVFPPIPSEVVLPLTGFLVARGKLTFAGAVGAATAGAYAGALILYVLGRWGGRPLVLRYGRLLRIDERSLDRAEGWFARWGDGVVLLARVVPLARSVVSVPAGVMRMSLLRFSALTIAGTAVWNLALIWAGLLLGRNWETISHLAATYSTAVVVVLGAAVVVSLAVLVLRQRARNRPRHRASQTKKAESMSAPQRSPAGSSDTTENDASPLPSPPRRAGGRRYAWLLIGTALFLFGVHGRWGVPLAAWLFAVFLLRFSRASRPAVAVLWTWLAACAATGFWLYQAQLFSPALLLVGLVLTPFLVVPFLFDRLVAPRLAHRSGLLATLVFPLSKAACELLAATLTPFGTIFGVLGTTQHGNLPLIQIASVTGVYGISFLVAWFGSVATWLWEHGLSRPVARNPVAVYACVLAAVLLGGGARLAFAPPTAQTVRIAGVSPSAAASERQGQVLARFGSVQEMVAAEPGVMHQAFTKVYDDLLASTRREARAGAELVLWPESAALVMQGNQAELLGRIKRLARRESVYIDAGLTIYGPGEPNARNLAVLITPTGQVAWKYEKAHPIPVLESYPPGKGVTPVADTPFGRLSNVVCYDAVFPALMRQAGRDGVDIMLVPANTWKGIGKLYVEAALFRAVENGYSVVIQASQGQAIAYDYQGRTIATTDYFTTDQQTMVAYVPTQGVRTIYSYVGDLFAWLCVAGTVTLTTLAVVLTVRKNTEIRISDPTP